jgi:hypothetical protein
MTRAKRMLTSGLLGLLAAGVGACDRGPAATPDPDDATAKPVLTSRARPARDARQTVEQIRRLRADAAVAEMSRHILPDQRNAVVDRLLAVDRMVASHKRLKQAMTDRIGPGAGASIDVVALANIVGVFSPDVELIDVTTDADEAVVTFCVNEQVPLERVTLVLEDGQWLLQPEPVNEDITVQLRKLGEAADRVKLLVDSKDMSAEEARHELALRQAPILRRIAELTGDDGE